MPLPEDYLRYPARQAGFDQRHYGYDPLPDRSRIELKSGLKLLAVPIVPLAFFPLDPPKEPFVHPEGMKTPYPDLRHYTVRDYGNRVGVFRLLKVLSSAAVKATFAVDAATAERYPPLLSALREEGHEIAAHGVSSAHLHHEGLSEDEERALIARVRKILPEAKSWLSPARNVSFRTLDLLAEAGFKVTLDWEMDQRPAAMATKNGVMTSIPHYQELSDAKLLLHNSQSEEEWETQIVAAAQDGIDRFRDEGAAATAFTLTPYVAGQPFRIHALKNIIRTLSTMDGAAIVTAAEAAAQFEAAAS